MEAWAAAYPQLFDDRDVSNARSQRKHGYHYHEWLVAILLLHTRGYLSLMKKYAYPSHVKKRGILKDIMPAELLPLFTANRNGRIRHWPDLLVYSPQVPKDWFLCEVKGPSDDVRDEQEADFCTLERETGKPVQLVTLTENPRH